MQGIATLLLLLVITGIDLMQYVHKLHWINYVKTATKNLTRTTDFVLERLGNNIWYNNSRTILCDIQNEWFPKSDN
jgi:hypothetical protein